MNWTFSLLFLLFYSTTFSQTLDASRSVDWTLAGLKDTITTDFLEIDMQSQGAIGDGVTANDSIMDKVLISIVETGATLNFPTGNFLFNQTIHLPSNIIIKGQGANSTTFTMDLGGTGHSLSIQGSSIASDTTSIIEFAPKDSNFIIVSDPASFSAGNWLKIIQNDSNLVTSSWAKNSVGQIIKIRRIINNRIVLESPLRLDFDLVYTPYIIKIIPVKNVGIECLKLLRMDDTAPQQSSNINFSYAVNCWVTGIESENCTFSHIQARRSSNLYISKSYFHHGFNYGGGGRAYGVMLHATSNECLVENNIFEHLRHSMIVQSGANGNVFAYNYSFDPFWESDPSDAAGDLVLHGNYTYANLFEQNICQQVVIDNSHGPNGPYNTILRNRAEGFGIFFSRDNSPSQNILGNEIPNDEYPYNAVNYTIQGTGHFIYGNNDKGIIDPVGTEIFPDLSYAYLNKPEFLPLEQWARIGSPNIMGTATIPAYDRYHSGVIFNNTCDNLISDIKDGFQMNEKILIFPNPVQSEMKVESKRFIENLTIFNSTGQKVYRQNNIGFSNKINVSSLENGIYLLSVNFTNESSTKKLFIKTNSF